MSGKMKANPGLGRIWNLLATYKMVPSWNWRPCSANISIMLPKAGHLRSLWFHRFSVPENIYCIAAHMQNCWKLYVDIFTSR